MATDFCLRALPAAIPPRALTASSLSEWGVAVLHDLTQVQDMLDWLENHGVYEREVTALDSHSFAIRWR